LYPTKLYIFKVDDFEISVSSLNHQRMLFYFSYCDIFFHRNLYCFFHNELRCGKCAFNVLSSRYSCRSFEFDEIRDIFVTYVNYVAGGLNGMHLSWDKDFYDYLEAFKETDMTFFFDLVADEEVNLLEHISILDV